MTSLLLIGALASASTPIPSSGTTPTKSAGEPVLKKGDTIEAKVEIHSVNLPGAELEIDQTEFEDWKFTVEGVSEDSLSLLLTRRLVETRLDGAMAPPPAVDAPLTDKLILRPNGGLGYRPFARTPLEGRLWRILEGMLPSATGGAASREFVESTKSESEGMPEGVFGRTITKRAAGLIAASITYREIYNSPPVRALGRISVDEKSGLPLYWSLRVTGLRLPGGEDEVITDVTLIATKAKLRGKDFGLVEGQFETKPKGEKKGGGSGTLGLSAR